MRTQGPVLEDPKVAFDRVGDDERRIGMAHVFLVAVDNGVVE
jgi:hypothetical protein